MTYFQQDGGVLLIPADLWRNDTFFNFYVGSTQVLVLQLSEGLAEFAGDVIISETLTIQGSIVGPVNVDGALQVGNGTNSAPSISFTNDTDTGFYLSTPGSVLFVIGGSVMWTSQAGATQFLHTLQAYGGLQVEGSIQLFGQLLLDLDEAGPAMVGYGVPDSGGTGYRLLRVPNA